jgi:exonuclease VII large subunit
LKSNGRVAFPVALLFNQFKINTLAGSRRGKPTPKTVAAEALLVSESVYRTRHTDIQQQLTELKTTYEELKQENRAIREQGEHYQQHMASDRHQEHEQFRYTALQLQTQLDQSFQQYQKLERQHLELDMQKKSADVTLEQLRVQQLTDQQDSAKLSNELSALKASHQEMHTQLNILRAKESETFASQ